MKKMVLAFLCILALATCKKDTDDIIPMPQEQELSFSIIPKTAPEGGMYKDWECKPYEPDYLQVTIDSIDYFPQVYRIDGNLYSQNIKLYVPEGQDSITYIISKFLLWDNGNTYEDTLPGVNDTIIMGTPDTSSLNAVYISTLIDYIFTVSAFSSPQINMEVLCVEPNAYLKQGDAESGVRIKTLAIK